MREKLGDWILEKESADLIVNLNLNFQIVNKM